MPDRMSYVGPNRRKKPGADMQPVILTKKLAQALNGIMLAGFRVGDRICLGKKQASVLIMEGWAVEVPPGQRRQTDCG